jgi:hypothetical protein
MEVWLRHELAERASDELEQEVELVHSAVNKTRSVADRAQRREQLEGSLQFLEHAVRVTDGVGVLAFTPGVEGDAVTVLDTIRPGLRVTGRRDDVEVVVAAPYHYGDTVMNFRLAIGATLVAMLLLSGGAGYRLAARALRPVDEIVRTVNRKRLLTCPIRKLDGMATALMMMIVWARR